MLGFAGLRERIMGAFENVAPVPAVDPLPPLLSGEELPSFLVAWEDSFRNKTIGEIQKSYTPDAVIIPFGSARCVADFYEGIFEDNITDFQVKNARVIPEEDGSTLYVGGLSLRICGYSTTPVEFCDKDASFLLREADGLITHSIMTPASRSSESLLQIYRELISGRLDLDTLDRAL